MRAGAWRRTIICRSGRRCPGAWGRSGVPCYGQTDTTLKFTGQERDAENGLDNFLARHLAGAQGRFLSVDPDNAGADLGDPQSWNGYGYVGNNPLVNTDRVGCWCSSMPGGGDSGADGTQDQNPFWTFFDLATLPMTFTQQQAGTFVQHVTNYIAAPISAFRNSAGCTNAVTAGLTLGLGIVGSEIGARTGAALAVETGPGLIVATGAGAGMRGTSGAARPPFSQDSLPDMTRSEASTTTPGGAQCFGPT